MCASGYEYVFLCVCVHESVHVWLSKCLYVCENVSVRMCALYLCLHVCVGLCVCKRC